MGKDYYKVRNMSSGASNPDQLSGLLQILGVSKDADEDACRKAYKKLALKQ